MVTLELRGDTREDVLAELVGLLHGGNSVNDIDIILEQLLDRERQLSTAIGHGIAVPHVISTQVTRPVILFGRSASGVSFSSSIFRRPVHLVFVIMAPEAERSRYLVILSDLIKLLRHRRVHESLMSATSPTEAISVLTKHEALIRLHSDLGI